MERVAVALLSTQYTHTHRYLQIVYEGVDLRVKVCGREVSLQNRGVSTSESNASHMTVT